MKPRGRSRKEGGGFTLIELMLVMAIIGIAAAVAVPIFARSFRGAKLRNSIRTVLMVNRHAQTKSVLGQQYMAVLFDEVKGTLEVVEQGQPGVKKDVFFGSVGGSGGGMGDVAAGGDSPPEEAAAPMPDSVMMRRLEEGVQILGFKGGREIDGIHYVSYYPNGMCEGYTIEIGDDEERRAKIQVDPVTGKAKVKRE